MGGKKLIGDIYDLVFGDGFYALLVPGNNLLSYHQRNNARYSQLPYQHCLAAALETTKHVLLGSSDVCIGYFSVTDALILWR